MSTPAPPPRTFGRIKGRPLKASQAHALAAVAPLFALDVTRPIEPVALFGPRPVALEIGFGAGEHLVAQARAQPDWGFIGVEPFLNGFSAAARAIGQAGLESVRLHQGDARDVIAHLPDASLTRVWILFPDPWPKTRHHKRRLIQPDFVAALARVLKPGGAVRFATDWADYAAWTLAHFTHAPDFDWIADAPRDWRTPFEGHVTTRYEAKRLGDCAPIFLEFVRR